MSNRPNFTQRMLDRLPGTYEDHILAEHAQRIRSLHNKYRSQLTRQEFDDLMVLELIKVFADDRLLPVDRVMLIFEAGIA